MTELTHTEWAVLDCLWTRSPLTLMELVAQLKQSMGWAKSTTATMVRRMEEKGLITSQTVGKAKAFSTNVDRDKAEEQETKSFLTRVYKGSVGLMMSAMAKKQALSREEIDELYGILQQAERTDAT